MFTLSNGLPLSFVLYYLIKMIFRRDVYTDTAVRMDRRRTPRRAVSWAAPLSQVDALVRVRGMAPLATELPPDGVAVRVRAYVVPTVVPRAVPPTERAPVAVSSENDPASVPTAK